MCSVYNSYKGANMPVDVYLRNGKELLLKYSGDNARSDDVVSYFNGYYEKGGGPPRNIDEDDWERDVADASVELVATNVDWEAIEIALIDFIRDNHATLQMRDE